MPRSYSRELPRLANGPAASFPRVYGIALELISHVDGRVDAVSLNGFIASYQTVTPLKLGELWAVPIMLRLALIENLRRVAARLASRTQDRDLAADWAERMVEVVEQNPTDLILVMADMARANPPLSGAVPGGDDPALAGAKPVLRLRQQLAGAPAGRAGPDRSNNSSRRKARHRPPTRSRSATASTACAFSARTTGAISSRHTAWWNRSCATIRQRLRRMDFATPRPLPARRRGDRQAEPVVRTRSGAQGDSTCPKADGSEDRSRSKAAGC